MITIVDKDKMILKGVYKASCSLIRTDRQLSNWFILKACRTEKAIELLFSFIAVFNYDEAQCVTLDE